MNTPRAKADLFLWHLEPLQRMLEVSCRRMLRDSSEVEDVLQTAITNAFADFHRFVEGTNFKAWIFRYLTLEVFNRNRRRETVSLDQLPSDLSAEESWELIASGEAHDRMLEDPDIVLEFLDDSIRAGLNRLSAVERACLVLHAVGQLKYREIHELLEIPIGSVMWHLWRARQLMQIQLAEYANERGLFRRNPSPEGQSNEL